MVTDKNKEKFDLYVLNNYDSGHDTNGELTVMLENTIIRFKSLPFEMQIGVYLKYLRDEFQVVLCIYTNASGYLWSTQNIGGTDLGWSGTRGGDHEYSGCWKSYESSFKNAFGLITKMSFNEWHSHKDFTHCGNYVTYLKKQTHL